jgi:hypothetical protein
MGAVTSNLSDWKARNLDTRAGSVTYVNVESDLGSPLYLAIRNRRVDVVKFIVERGGAISDREFLVMHRRGNVKRLLLRMVDQLVDQVHDEMHTQQVADVPSQTLESNNHVIDVNYTSWAFPPTWKSGVELSITQWESCGLPPNMFQSKVLPFLAHDWFFTKEQLTRRTCNSDLPAILSPSGEPFNLPR